jgi:hypothetical protein
MVAMTVGQKVDQKACYMVAMTVDQMGDSMADQMAG